MKRLPLLVPALALAVGAQVAACHKPETREKIREMENAARAGPKPPAGYHQEENGPLLHFAYEFPAEAAAIPAVAARLRKDLALAQQDALDTARESQAARQSTGNDFVPHEFSRSWSTAGQTPALLSLVATTSAYTGGAHPNHGSSALLWDRKAAREIQLISLFSSPTQFTGQLTGPWCEAITAAQAKRRGGASVSEVFDACPPLADLAIVPADSDANGKFDRLRLLADPYVAGPYSEGDYEVDFALQPEWLAAIKPGWRESFESQPQ